MAEQNPIGAASLLITLMVIPASANAADFYVCGTNASGCSDCSNGSSIQTVVSQHANDGDTIYVCGDFSSTVTVTDGITFEGTDSGANFTAASGHSFEIYSGAWSQRSLTLRNLTFKNHTHDSAVVISKYTYYWGTLGFPPEVTIDSCTFQGNTASNGPALYADGGDFTIVDSTFTLNQASNGAAHFNGDYFIRINADISDTTFYTNTASATGGALFANYAEVSIDGSLFSNNESDASGAAIRAVSSSIEVSNTLFTGNSSDSEGGAISIAYSDLDLHTAAFVLNSAASNGGGVVLNNSSLSTQDTLWCENEAQRAGAIYTDHDSNVSSFNNIYLKNSAQNFGGALYNAGGSVSLTNNHLIGNSVNSSNATSLHSESEKVVFINNLVADGTMAVKINSNGSWSVSPLSFDYNHWVDSSYEIGNSLTDGSNNTGSGEPSLYAPFPFDENQLPDCTTLNFDPLLLRPQPPSSLIDAGNPQICDPIPGGGSCVKPASGSERSDIGAFGGTNGPLWFHSDGDGDGYAAVQDCDDDDPSTFDTTAYFRDYDHDTYGDAGVSLEGCVEPNGYVTDNTDCDDFDPAVAGPEIWYNDNDWDGLGDPATALDACSEPYGNSVLNGDDCDDDDPTTGDQSVDADCDGLQTDEDCDDNDPANTLSDDCDADSVLSDDDCDDHDPTLGDIALDADCDGVLTFEDCDDSDDTNLLTDDCDQDGVSTSDDCDDTDPAIIWMRSNDADCDGVATSDDCDDDDPNNKLTEDCDSDGVPTSDDCDDDDPGLGDIALDADCDGVAKTDDCDDDDPNNVSADDCDDDGVLAIDDCDDEDPDLGDIALDADCDGVLTTDDCDDSDPNNLLIDDCDQDSVPSDEDCDDHDATLGATALDADCDGVLTTNDCDDTNPLNVLDNDCDQDSIPTSDDCDDTDPTNTYTLSTDADCDGVLTTEDCDDTDPLNVQTTDCDQDSVATADDCDDHDPTLGDIGLDADCDGVLTVDDCDDSNPAILLTEDCDQDSIPAEDDCNDHDSALGMISLDADCDGVLTVDDCDDSDPSNQLIDDCDQDHVATADDCDDNNPALGDIGLDADCDGIQTNDDCDDNDPDILLDDDCDQDGVPTDDDCDDADPSVGGGAIFYNDGDGDSLGDPNTSVTACSQPANYVTNNVDCDDSDSQILEVRYWYEDNDNDGYGDSDEEVVTCEAPPGSYVTNAGDCDDTRSDLNPETSWYPDCDEDGYYGESVGTQCEEPADYTCDNGKSPEFETSRAAEDCDDSDPTLNAGTNWYFDEDGDGYGDRLGHQGCLDSYTGATAIVRNNDDCDDDLDEVSPGATEICNGVDDDCDGVSDEADAEGTLSWRADCDGDGYPGEEVLFACAPSPAPGDTPCDDDEVPDGGWYEEFDSSQFDCDDENPLYSPDTLWYPDMDGDSHGDPAGPTLTQCERPGDDYSLMGDDCDDQQPTTNPSADEVCNGVDDNCDEKVDEDTAIDAPVWRPDCDGDGFYAEQGERQCEQPLGGCERTIDTGSDSSSAGDEPLGGWTSKTPILRDCDDFDPNEFPGQSWYIDADADSFGSASDDEPRLRCNQPEGYVSNRLDCDDEDPSVNPDAPELTSDDVDNNCDEFSAKSWIGGTGCGCTTGAGKPQPWFALIPLIWLLRRRDRALV